MRRQLDLMAEEVVVVVAAVVLVLVVAAAVEVGVGDEAWSSLTKRLTFSLARALSRRQILVVVVVLVVVDSSTMREKDMFGEVK